MCAVRQDADRINSEMNSNIANPAFRFKAKDYGISARGNQPEILSTNNYEEIMGLKKNLSVKCGSKVMLTTNLNVAIGLCNGTQATVKAIFKNDDQNLGVLLYVPAYRGQSNFCFLNLKCISKLIL